MGLLLGVPKGMVSTRSLGRQGCYGNNNQSGAGLESWDCSWVQGSAGLLPGTGKEVAPPGYLDGRGWWQDCKQVRLVPNAQGNVAAFAL